MHQLGETGPSLRLGRAWVNGWASRPAAAKGAAKDARSIHHAQAVITDVGRHSAAGQSSFALFMRARRRPLYHGTRTRRSVRGTSRAGLRQAAAINRPAADDEQCVLHCGAIVGGFASGPSSSSSASSSSCAARDTHRTRTRPSGRPSVRRRRCLRAYHAFTIVTKVARSEFLVGDKVRVGGGNAAVAEMIHI